MTTGFEIGKPTVEEAPHIAALINGLSEKGLLLPRSVNDVYERLRDFVVAKRQDRMIGCAALHVVWGGLGEIRSVAVAENARKAGVGRALVRFCLQEAAQLGIRQDALRNNTTRDGHARACQVARTGRKQ